MMVYQNKLVCVVKCNGKVLREQGEFVTLPFGSEYSLLFKNLNSQRAVITIEIDGQDVLDGNEIVIAANSERELKGFMKGSSVSNAFKFIQKTQKIADHRGDKIDDGFIRVEYRYEIEKPVVYRKTIIHDHHHVNHHHHHTFHSYTPPVYGSSCRGITGQSVGMGDSVISSSLSHDSEPKAQASVESNVTMDSLDVSNIQQDEGITVKGSEQTQQFTATTVGDLTPPDTIIIRLRGENSKGKVHTPITIQTKLTCETCGTKSKSSVKYCPDCGTNLQ